MGYDMYWVEEDPKVEARVAELQAEFDRAVKARNDLGLDEARDDPRYLRAQKSVELAYDALYAEKQNYFRLNIWGMGEARQILHMVDCASDEDLPGSWPSIPDELRTKADVEGEDGPAMAEIMRLEDEFRGYDTGGVLPLQKVSDNSGWLVTPAECRATAMAWYEGGGRMRAIDSYGGERNQTEFEQQSAKLFGAIGAKTEAEVIAPREEPNEAIMMVDAFVDWMVLAAEHGGFRVY